MLADTVHLRLASLGIAASLLFIVACGSDETPASTPASTQAPTEVVADEPAGKPAPPEIPSNLKVEERDADGNPVRFSGTDGMGNEFEASIGEDAKVPSSFPKDVPLYPGAQPMAAMSAGSEGTMVTFKTDESQQDIFDFYTKQLAEQGWEVSDGESFGGQLGLEGLKGSRKTTVSISGTKGDSRISVIVTDAP
jgi:hypothetical protein